MLELKQILETKERKGHALLEMPTGTGKTMCILAVYLSLKDIYPNLGKLIYCTRTITELNQCMDELKTITKYRKEFPEFVSAVEGTCVYIRKLTNKILM
ncbi:DNA repair helicase [Blastocystis sp. subtype 4]|uniref:DNA repair helicase n=1 Tax=Blastocystis sp. subtype 4 TaxID=944170 RepID=UPI000711A361|nr:DNA repair helicase [Blastocystis sp. subtype 4]KNB42784.1 DNA repair helicase [Blastocystis sp. subtype 4]|eukprot:XP_014526227.1 DNA repair helicase [Blastocystis sp. subtype 4]